MKTPIQNKKSSKVSLNNDSTSASKQQVSFQDNRPESVAQLKYQEMANKFSAHSPAVKPVTQLKEKLSFNSKTIQFNGPFDKTPKDLLVKIGGYLNTKDRASLSMTNKKNRNVLAPSISLDKANFLYAELPGKLEKVPSLGDKGKEDYTGMSERDILAYHNLCHEVTQLCNLVSSVMLNRKYLSPEQQGNAKRLFRKVTQLLSTGLGFYLNYPLWLNSAMEDLDRFKPDRF